MMSRGRIILSVVVILLGIGVRAWLLREQPVNDEPFPMTLGPEYDPIVATIAAIKPLHEKKHPIQPGDWLEHFPEGGQSYAHYVHAKQHHPLHLDFSKIDVQPLGEFDETQLQLVHRTVEFMGHFFGVPVQELDPLEMGEIPESAQRMRKGERQILTTWILFDILKPRRDPKAIATIALVTGDLWPGDLNWVFGQASLTDRVGVWSLHRNGDPRASQAEFRLCLRRTLKTAVHETGHMLGIPHCAAWECCMNGSRNREESDRQPLEFCHECQAKIWWTCNADPLQRAQALFDFCQKWGLDKEAEPFRKERDALSLLPGGSKLAR